MNTIFAILSLAVGAVVLAIFALLFLMAIGADRADQAKRKIRGE